MLRRLRAHLPILVTAVLTATVFAAGPTVAQAAYDAVNSDKVDGRHAVGSGASSASRAGKLVATNSSGRLPNNIISKAPNADQLDGLDSIDFLRWNDTAFNSDQLDGLDSTNFSLAANDSVFASGDPASGTLTDGSKTIATLELTAPADGYVLVTARATFNARKTGTYLYADLQVDGSSRATSGWEPGDVDTFTDAANELLTVYPVMQGAHTFALEVYQGNAGLNTDLHAQYSDAVITAQYFHTPGPS